MLSDMTTGQEAVRTLAPHERGMVSALSHQKPPPEAAERPAAGRMKAFDQAILTFILDVLELIE